MGRPIKKKYIKTTSTHHITCNAWVPGDSGNKTGTIKAQKTSNRYKATTSFGTGLCKLVTGIPAAAGQMSITVNPYVVPVTAAIFVVNMTASAATTGALGSGYTNGTFTATVVGGTNTGAATLTVTVAGGVITGAVVLSGGNYTALPANPVSITGGSGTLATFNITYGVLNFNDTGHVGSGYGANTTVQFIGGGFAVQATGSVTVSGGTLTSPTISVAGSGYTTIPTVFVESLGATEYVRKLNDRTVETFLGNRYKWEFVAGTNSAAGTASGNNTQGTGTLGYAVIQGT